MGSPSTSLSGASLRRRLPKPIWQRLWAMFRRARRMALLKGFFVVLTTALLCLLGIMAVDAMVTIFSQLLRLALSLGALGIVLGAAWWWMVRPALRRMDLTSVARLVEERHPELEETVSSAVEFLSSEEPEEIRGSEELIGEVVKSAVRDVGTISPRREFDARASRPWVLTSLSIAFLLVLLGVLWPKPTLRLLVRAVAPFQEVGNAYADTLQVTPGDTRVAAGSDLTIEVSIVHPRLKRATVRRREAEDQPEGVERMNLTGTGEDGVTRFSLVFPAVQKDFTYRVHAGNALSRSFEVRVVEPPRVESVSARYEYPAYTGLAPREEVCQSGEIAALEHTKVRLRARVSEPVREGLFIRGGDAGKALAAKLAEGADPEWEWVMGRRIDESWELQIRDEEGFANAPVTGQIRSIPDEAPEVRLTSPEARELRLRPSEYLPLAYEAREDFGFARAELIVKLDGKETPVLLPVPPPQATGGGDWLGKAGLSLGELDLERVNRLTVQLRLVDTLPLEWGGGQEALSEELAIRLERGAKSLVEQILESQEQEIRRDLDKAQKDLQSAKARGDEAAQQFARNETVTGLSKLEESRRAIGQAESRMQELAARMEKTAFEERAREMKEIAGGPVREARVRAETAPLMDRPEDRTQQLQEMSEKLGEAIGRMGGVLTNLQKSKDEARRVAELARLAQEQQRLAQQARRDMQTAELSKVLEARNPAQAPERANVAAQALAAWKREQERLQKELAELLRKDPEALREAMLAQAREAVALAKEAETLQKDQKNLEELTGAAEQAGEAQAAEMLRRDLLRDLKAEEQAIEQDANALRQELRKRHPAATDAHEQLAEAAAQAQRAARGMADSEMAPAREAAAQAEKALQKAAGEAREELAKEAIRERTERLLEGTAVQAGKLSEPVEKALGALARDLAEKLVETEWPAGQPVSLEQKLGEAVEAVKQAMAEAQNEAPAGESDGGEPRMAEKEALARAVTQKGQEMLQRWEPGQAPAGRPMSPPAPVPADAEAVRSLGQLAERQESVARALDALARGQLEEALAARQEQMAAQAAELSGEATALQKAAAASPQSQGRTQADQARAELDQAEKQALTAARDLGRAQQAQDQKQAAQAMAEAGGAMSQAEALEQARSGEVAPQPQSDQEKGALRSSRQAQQRASQALAQAAQRLTQAGETLAEGAKAAGEAKGTAQPRLANPEELARSFSKVSQAAQSEDATEAASLASNAAEGLRQMAWDMAEKMGPMENWADSLLPPGETGQPAQNAAGQNQAAEPGSAGMNRQGAPLEVRGDGVPPGIARWGVSAEDWARLKGTLGSNVTQDVQAGMPLEYRGLVSDYFRALAEEAGKNAEGGAGNAETK